MTLLIMSLSLNAQISNTTSVENPLIIKRTTLPITIDGNPNDVAWSSISWITLTKSSYNWSDNFSAYFKMIYDDNNVYVLVKVYDNTPFYIYESEWQSDNVTIFFSMDINYQERMYTKKACGKLDT